MKKRVLAILVMMMTAAVLAACSGEKNNASDEVAENVTVQDETETPAENEDVTSEDQSADAVDGVTILSDVWATYGENEKFYGMGGDANNMVENAPGNFSLEDKEALKATLLVPEDAADMIDEAASLVHGMNLNIFTGAVFRVTDPANVQAFADAMETSILNNQWMCGSPDKYMIYKVNDNYVLMAFGAVDVLPVFKDKFMAIYGEKAEVLKEGNVAQ